MVNSISNIIYCPPTDEIVSWWDELASAARSHKIDILAKIGRQGERLSVIYETERIGEKPVWQSVESNLSGFDILSKVDSQSQRPLMIEVKSTSERLEAASFCITRNEWETAILTENYIFHLWVLQKQPRLAIVTKDRLEPHIPFEKGFGRWENVTVPFKCYEQEFKEPK